MLCAVDLGTTKIKAGLYTLEGALVASASGERPINFPEPGHAEQSLTAGWDLLCAIIRQAVADAGIRPGEIEAVVLSTQRGSFLALDIDEQPLTELILWMDRRGLAICERLKAEVGLARYYAGCGHPINPYVGVSKLCWLREAAPDLYARTYRFIPEHTYYHRKLGADSLVCDTATASFLAPLDIHTKSWNRALFSQVGLETAKFPDLAPATAVIGQVAASVAEQCGLAPGVKLILGGGDGQCAGVGSGTVRPGTVMINFGTAAGVQAYLPDVRLDPNHALNCAAHIVPYAWEIEGHTQASGATFRWVRDQIASAEVAVAAQLAVDPYDLLTRGAERVPAGAEGLLFLPSFNGLSAPLDFPEARGAFLGLTLKHTRAHLVRAVMEGVLLEIRWLLAAFEKAGAGAGELRAVGGAMVSPVWGQLMADVLQRPVNALEVADATLTGAAQCAAVALGHFDNFQESAQAWVRVSRIFEPDPRRANVYEDLFGIFEKTYQMLAQAGIFAELNRVETIYR